MNISQTFEYESEPKSFHLVVDDVTRLLDKAGVSQKERYPFVLAVSEALTNAIIHGNRRNPAKKVKVTVAVNEKLLSADIIDEGQGGLDRIRQRKPSTPKDEGGRGIDLIEHYATSVGYVQIPAGGLKVEIRIERKTDSVVEK
ncbi:MAG TPA: ATP-binding protein [candidate division Zixibacteria bacterium]|nr:ATP-binding protein [candidate division Zixibacteria bacterium]